MTDTRRLVATEELARTIRRQGRLQTWLARLIGQDKSAITHILKGRRTISYAHAELIAAALGSDIFLLFEFAYAPDQVAEKVLA